LLCPCSPSWEGLDPDNTLVDRRGVFTTWAGDFVSGVDGDATDQEWLIVADQDGYRPRAELAALMRARFRLRTPVPDLVDRLRRELPEHIQAHPGVVEALHVLVEPSPGAAGRGAAGGLVGVTRTARVLWWAGHDQGSFGTAMGYPWGRAGRESAPPGPAGLPPGQRNGSARVPILC
jgi:hypothetical protein